MNKREIFQLLHDKPDNFEIEFGTDGVVYQIGAHQIVKEWNTIYLGVDKEDLTESLIEWEMSVGGEDGICQNPRCILDDGHLVDGTPCETGLSDDDEDIQDREAFMEALARDEDKVVDCTGDVCTLPPRKGTDTLIVETNPTTEMM